MAAKESKINDIIVASDHSRSSKEEEEDHENEITRIDLGISFNKLSLRPKKKLLVLPIRGFIVHRAHLHSPTTIPKKRTPDFTYGNYLVYKRPFCEDFLKFCFERFQVGLWSSSIEDNLQNILTHVIGELKNKFVFTWDQNQCTKTELRSLDNKKKPILKELKNVWQNEDSSLPWYEGEYSPSNTLLITDPVKALGNPPNTAIFPEKYDAENMDDDYLGPDGELRAFLDGVAEAKDVQSYVEDHPFGEAAISPSHSDWDYYSEIIYYFGYEEITCVDKNWDYYSKVMLSFGKN